MAIAYTQMLQNVNGDISMAGKGKAPGRMDTPERLTRIIKEEEGELPACEDHHDALRQLGRFLDEVHMHKRIHSSLGVPHPGRVQGIFSA